MPARRAIFLDKNEGTLIESVPHALGHSRKRIAPAAVHALRRLSRAGFELVVLSNQPGVALGHFPYGALGAVEQYLGELFLAADLKLAACYWCPHHPDGTIEELAFRCMCRKPEPGLLQMAAHEREIDLGESWLIAETPDDVEAGRRAGCSILRLDGGLDEAADAILARRVDPRVSQPSHVAAGSRAC